MPLVWIVTAGRTGDFKQMQALAEALGWPFEVKSLRFHAAGSGLLAAFPRCFLVKGTPDPFDQNDPGLVLCAEGPAAAYVAGIKRRQNRAFKLVCLGRPRGHFDAFDLVITSPQYALRHSRRVLELNAPLHVLNPAVMEAAALRHEALAHGMSRPLTVVLIGGPSPPECLDRNIGLQIGRDLADRARFSGGSMLVVTSPRTPEGVGDAIAGHLGEKGRLVKWSPEANQLYQACLSLADDFVVTSDSVSMTVETLMTGRPVLSYALPGRKSWLNMMAEKLESARLARPLFDSGLLEVRPDRGRLLVALAARYRLAPFSPTAAVTNLEILKPEMSKAVVAVHGLFEV